MSLVQGSEDAVRVVMLNNDYCINCFRCKVLYLHHLCYMYHLCYVYRLSNMFTPVSCVYTYVTYVAFITCVTSLICLQLYSVRCDSYFAR